MLIVVFVAELGFSGPMIAGVPLLAKEAGWGVRTVGWVLGGFGLGAAAAAGFLLWRKNVHRTGLAALSGLTAMGLSVVGLIGAGFYGTLVTSAVLKLAPTGQIGRVMSALSFASLGAVPITYALTGLVTGVSSAQVPFLIGGSLILVVAAVVFANPQLRHLSMNPTARARETANQNLRV